MASKVKKGFLYYLLWFVFIAFGIVCIFASILLFNPNKDVFGIGLRYVTDRRVEIYEGEQIFGSNQPTNPAPLLHININGGFTDVQVVRTSEFEKLTFVVNKKLVGFSNRSINRYSINTTLDTVNSSSSLNVSISEPSFWLPLSKSAKLTIHCPEQYNLSLIYLNITTTSGNVSLDSLNSAHKLEVGQLDITTKKGKIYTAPNFSITSGIVNINAESSVIDIYSNVTKQLNIKTKDSKLYVDKIDGNLKIDSNKLSAKCGTIGDSLIYSSAKGFITVDKIVKNFIGDTDDQKTHIANVTITEVLGSVTIPAANASNINIQKIGGGVVIKTTTGKVNLGILGSDAQIETTKGDVTLTQTNSFAATKINTNSGKIVANFTEVGTATLVTNTNNIEVNVANGKAYNFEYLAKDAISVSWITTSLPLSGTIPSPDATASTQSKIIANAPDGKITLNSGYVIATE